MNKIQEFLNQNSKNDEDIFYNIIETGNTYMNLVIDLTTGWGSEVVFDIKPKHTLGLCLSGDKQIKGN